MQCRVNELVVVPQSLRHRVTNQKVMCLNPSIAKLLVHEPQTSAQVSCASAKLAHVLDCVLFFFFFCKFTVYN